MTSESFVFFYLRIYVHAPVSLELPRDVEVTILSHKAALSRHSPLIGAESIEQ